MVHNIVFIINLNTKCGLLLLVFFCSLPIQFIRDKNEKPIFPRFSTSTVLYVVSRTNYKTVLKF